MKKYNWFQKVFFSLAPGEFYLRIYRDKLGHAISYMMLFILFLSIGTGLFAGLTLKSSIDATLDDYNKGLIPQLSVVDGELQGTMDEAITIEHFNMPIILDVEGHYDVQDALGYKNFMLLQKNRVAIKAEPFGLTVSKYSDLFLFLTDMTSSDLVAMFRAMSIIVVPIFILTMTIVGIISFFFNSVFFLMLANISRTMAGLKLTLGQVYTMVIYAMTFSVFWQHFMMVLPSRIPMWLDNAVYFIIPPLILVNVFVTMRKIALKNAK